MPIAAKYRGGVLVLPGGKPESTARSHPLQLTNQRVEWLARSLRRRLGSGVVVRRVQYQVRGWNSAARDALRDAAIALASIQEHFDAAKIVVVGHSMGGRVAAHLSASVDAQWMPIEGAGHYLLRQWPRWHQLTAEFAASQLSERLLEP
jgi:hypothetical protein